MVAASVYSRFGRRGLRNPQHLLRPTDLAFVLPTPWTARPAALVEYPKYPNSDLSAQDTRITDTRSRDSAWSIPGRGILDPIGPKVQFMHDVGVATSLDRVASF
jgi:hypothetical protein